MKKEAELIGNGARDADAFREPLEEHREFPRFKELRDFPEKIIRPIYTREANEDSGDMKKIIFTAKRLFEELRTKYNIDVAVDFILAGTKDRPEGYAVVDKIVGMDLRYAAKRYPDKEQIILEKVEHLLVSLTYYFIDKLKTGKQYLWDIGDPRQYMYGKRKEDTEDKLYLVDVDPLYYSANKYSSVFEGTILSLFHFLETMEGTFKTNFSDVRLEIKKAWADVPIEKRKEFYNLEARIGAL